MFKPDMYVCICNAVTDRQVSQAIKNGATTMPQLKTELNVVSSCGECLDCVEQCLEEVLSKELDRASCALN